MTMPKPGPAHAALSPFAGLWLGEEKLSPAPWLPQGAVRAARIENRWALGGLALIQDYAQSENGQVVFEGHGIFTYDASSQQYIL